MDNIDRNKAVERVLCVLQDMGESTGGLRWGVVRSDTVTYMVQCAGSISLDLQQIHEAREPEEMIRMRLTEMYQDLADANQKRADCLRGGR